MYFAFSVLSKISAMMPGVETYSKCRDLASLEPERGNVSRYQDVAMDVMGSV